MRKGHDFPKDEDVGEFVQLWPMGWKTHMSSSFVLFQPLSLRKATGGWGSYDLWEWGGRTVSPHPHTHSTHNFAVHPLTQTLLPLDELQNTQAQQFRVLPVVVHLHALPIICSWFSHTWIFLVSPTLFFLHGFENGVAPSFTHGLNCGFGIVIVHALVLGGFGGLTQTFSSSPRLCWRLTHLQFAPPPLLCTLTQRNSFPFFVFTHRILLDLPTQ